MQSGERAGEAADGVRHDAVAEARVGLEVLVGVDQDLVHLRREPREDRGDHRLAVQQLQALVDAAHAAPLAARKHDSGHAVHGVILGLVDDARRTTLTPHAPGATGALLPSMSPFCGAALPDLETRATTTTFAWLEIVAPAPSPCCRRG